MLWDVEESLDGKYSINEGIKLHVSMTVKKEKLGSMFTVVEVAKLKVGAGE